VTENFRSSENLQNFLLNEDKEEYDFRKVYMKFIYKNKEKNKTHTHICINKYKFGEEKFRRQILRFKTVSSYRKISHKTNWNMIIPIL
jgi:hypothetical protein